MRIIDVHTHPVFMGAGDSPRELADWIARARRAGVSHMIVLGDVLGLNPIGPEDRMPLILAMIRIDYRAPIFLGRDAVAGDTGACTASNP